MATPLERHGRHYDLDQKFTARRFPAVWKVQMTKQSDVSAPTVEWREGELKVSLPLHGGTVDANWRPATTTVVRIRQAGTENWSPGFETPLDGCSFVGLEPDTECDIQVTHKNAAGEGLPIELKCRTKSNGDVGNIIPFPKR